MSFTQKAANGRIEVEEPEKEVRAVERSFNTEGLCDPDLHYMVRLDERLYKIKKLLVDRGKYFVINRGRQYGKTTTLRALEGYLKEDYFVISMDFQLLSASNFEEESRFVAAFTRYLTACVREGEIFEDFPEAEVAALEELIDQPSDRPYDMGEMFIRISRFCRKSPKPVVMMIDEVDSASNNQVFLDFLAMLRGYYLERKTRPGFYSVILAGVYDIKNLKLKIRPESEHKFNSPWNIAAKFPIDMSFSVGDISSMLREYEEDNGTGMDVERVAEYIYEYTSGYPYLVSYICKCLDEEILGAEGFEDMGDVWSREGIGEAVKILLKETTPLFDSMVKQLDLYKDLKEMIEEILYQGKRVLYSPDAKAINIGMMFGLLQERGGQVLVANRIFEMRLLNMFITEESINSRTYERGERDRNQFITDTGLDMERVLVKFVEYFTDVYSDNDEKFVEAYGRKFFLLYLKPIINGVGNYYLEDQTRDAKRTDVVVDYLGEQFVVELKIWHGNEYKERGEEQLTGYLDYFRLDKGYMVSFNFNKKKVPGVNVIQVGKKTIVEAVV